MAKREQGSTTGAKNENALAVFEDFKIRRVYDEATETWYFSVVDIIAALIQQPDHQTARKYWNKLKERLKKEGSQTVTNCHRLKLEAADGKKYLTDVANPETLLRLIQSVPSPKAEPIKLWLACDSRTARKPHPTLHASDSRSACVKTSSTASAALSGGYL